MRRSGLTDDEIARVVAAEVDALLPLGIFGPVGAIAELVDGPVAYVVARLILASVKRPAEPPPLACGCIGGADCERCKFP